jgi:hypothetical protein
VWSPFQVSIVRAASSHQQVVHIRLFLARSFLTSFSGKPFEDLLELPSRMLSRFREHKESSPEHASNDSKLKALPVKHGDRIRRLMELTRSLKSSVGHQCDIELPRIVILGVSARHARLIAHACDAVSVYLSCS